MTELAAITVVMVFARVAMCAPCGAEGAAAGRLGACPWYAIAGLVIHMSVTTGFGRTGVR